MNINFDTDNMILCIYPRFAGGKFLKNCLGMDDKVVFQDSILAEKQLAGNFDITDKLQYLLLKLKQVQISSHWTDLELGCTRLFGFGEGDYTEITKSFKEIIELLSHSELNFILGVHHVQNLQPILNVWKNAKIIVFTNTKNFRRLRPSDTNKKVDWVNWDSDVVLELEKSKFNNKIFYFNNDSYFSEDDAIREIRKMYDCLNLNNFNEYAIREYYKNWIIKCLPPELIKNY
jgi:hypothetical protein